MRTAVLSCLLVLVAHGASGQGKSDQPPIPQDKWNLDYADKTWGLKLKGVSCMDGNQTHTLVVEFTKDLTPEELKAVKEAFPSGTDRKGLSKTVAFYFFDKEGVVMSKSASFWSTSERTGVKGDAFRVDVTRPGDKGREIDLKDVARVELRQVKEPPQTEKK